MNKVSEGTKSAQAINEAIDVRELSGEDAAEALSDFAGLELVPIPEDAEREKLKAARMSFRDSAWGWLP